MKNIYDIEVINEFTYSLKIKGEFIIPLYQTIKKMLKSVHYESETSSIFFSAESVVPLKKYLLELSYNNCIKMIDDLTKQMMYLKKMNYGFYGFDIDDIIVIDNTFIFCSTQYLLPLKEDNIFFYSPIKQPYFSNPELIELTTLPSYVNYKCVFYSLGLLVVFCLLKTYLLVGNEIKSTDEIENSIVPLKNTKIYWFIKRCLEEKIEKRVILLI
jgi:hypothetical protein